MKKTYLPVILLRGIIVLPYAELKIDLIEELDKKIINIAKENHEGYVLLVSPENYLEERIDLFDLPDLAVIGKVSKSVILPNGCTRVTIEGIRRVNVSNYLGYDGEEDVFAGSVLSPIRYAMSARDEAALIRKLKLELEHFIEIVPYASNSVLSRINEIDSVSMLADVIADYLPLTFERKYEYLKTVNPHTRVMMDLSDIQKELDVYEIERKIDANLKKGLDKSQKEFVLREKLRLIKEELGDVSSKEEDILELREKLNNLKAPKNIIKKIDKELKKYEATPSASPEIGIIRNYIETLLALPWNVYTKDCNNLIKARKILDDSHYGLDEIKERIIEYLAVKTRAVSNHAPIICLVGPPGVGKTSLAKSIATAMNRRFAKISVGGVNDPAEIIGHRRTYMGANPGRIINALKKCESNNPVFLIDEVDKMTKDIKGDPASSLLEVLDPEQNDKFYDNYVEEAYDLSKVMFILTANYADQIPEELKDRLEIIDLSCYTDYEKLSIAKTHLVKETLNEYQLSDKKVTFSDEVLLSIIRNYTREAGVRELKRIINKICMKLLKETLENNKKEPKCYVNEEVLLKYLGKPKYHFTDKINKVVSGVVNGLSYTPYGGDVLPIEVVTYPGKEEVKTTGNLGEVMRESAMIAIGHIKSHEKEYKIDLKTFDNVTIHINAIEGAIKKEGPSAGTCLTTAIISKLLNISVPNDVAMTGEMTLTGKVLPIGGLKEKAIGAFKSGVKTIFIPKENERDIDEIPKEVQEKLNIVLIENYDEIYSNLFKKKKVK